MQKLWMGTLFLVLGTLAHADTPTALFLFGQTSDVRSFAQGGAPGSANALDVFQEPAALGWSPNTAISLARWPGFIPGTDYNFAGVGMPLGGWAGIQVNYLGYGTGAETVEELDGSQRSVVLEQDNVYTVGLGARLAPWCYLGANAKALDSHLGEVATAQAYAGDADLLLRSLDDAHSLDLAILNVGSDINYGDVPEPLPQELRVGYSSKFELFGEHSVAISLGYGLLMQTSTDRISGGLEYGFGDLFTLSGGYEVFGEMQQVTAGLGARLYGADLSVGYGLPLNEPGFGESPLRFSLSYIFGPSTALDRGQAYMNRGLRDKALATWRSVGSGDDGYADAQEKITRYTNPPRYTIKAQLLTDKSETLAQGAAGQLVVHVFNAGGETGHDVRLTAALQNGNFWLGPLFPKYAAIAAGGSAVYSATVRYFGQGSAAALPVQLNVKDALGLTCEQSQPVTVVGGGRQPDYTEPEQAQPDYAAAQSLEPVPQTGIGRRPKGVAVIVGIEQYPHQLGDVTYATADAKMAKAYAEGVIGIPDQNVVLLTQADATRGHIEAALGRLKVRVPDADFLFFFYAGHGVPDPDNEASGEPYLVPSDGDLSPGAEATLIGLHDFCKRLSGTVHGPVVAMLDACFTGNREGRSIKSAAGNRGIIVRAKMNQPGITILSAASGSGPSLPDEEAGQGLFTYYTLLGLKGAADANGDGVITAQEALDYAKAQVAKTSGGREVPELLGNGGTVVGYVQ